MGFKVAARTIVELGAELISSDAIAFYELIKNAIDAESKTGATIEFSVTLSYHAYKELGRAWESESTIEAWRRKVEGALEADAAPASAEEVRTRLAQASTWPEIWEVVEFAYAELSFVEVRDTGVGMSFGELEDAFLTIGTPSRGAIVMDAVSKGKTGVKPPLGEKGVGRLAAMRLGEELTVTTTQAGDPVWNHLNIDWRLFKKDLGDMIEDIDIEPYRGSKKADKQEHGTTLRISRLTGQWSGQRLNSIATTQLARLTDPFEISRKRPKIQIIYNGVEVEFDRYIRKVLLGQHHARIRGVYRVSKTQGPRLSLKVTVPYYDRSEHSERLTEIDLLEIGTPEDVDDIPRSALQSLGNFEFDLYWFNRQKLRKPEDWDDTFAKFRELHKRWTGIMVYRDGFQVVPYGDENSDWLELDRRAFSSAGYKLNKYQFIGRVKISRVGNPHLVDQTNREGLRDCDEKSALLAIMRYSIWDVLKPLIEEAERASRQADDTTEDNPRFRKKKVAELKARFGSALREVSAKYPEGRLLYEDLKENFGGLERRYAAIERRLQEAEEERELLVDLAGIGLVIESLAHELTRSVENSARILRQHKKTDLPEGVLEFFETLRLSMQTIEQRLKVLDPLAVSARQRRRNIDLRKVVNTVTKGHERKFRDHRIEVEIVPRGREPLPIFAVEGRIIQILENLISNSVYWLNVQEKVTPSYQKSISIELISGELPGLRFSDNGPGIPPERSEKVFKPFFSTKKEKARQGLGLYIARESAEFHQGSVYLDENVFNEHGNLSTFVVEIPDTRKK